MSCTVERGARCREDRIVGTKEPFRPEGADQVGDDRFDIVANREEPGRKCLAVLRPDAARVLEHRSTDDIDVA